MIELTDEQREYLGATPTGERREVVIRIDGVGSRAYVCDKRPRTDPVDIVRKIWHCNECGVLRGQGTGNSGNRCNQCGYPGK